MSMLGALSARSARIGGMLARGYAEGNMLAAVKIERPGGRVFDRDLGRDVPAANTVVYEGVCRFYTVAGSATYGMGDEPQYFDSSTLSIPLDEPTPRIDDIATCTVHEDPRMIGRSFRIVGHETGRQMPDAQRMAITGIAPSKQSAP